MANPELWRLVPSVPGLLASSKGRVLVVPKFGTLPNGGQRQYGGIARKGSWDGERYIFQWQGKTYKVARLVCEAFHGAAPDGMNVCMHLDENSRNNVPGNLEWGTQKQNLNAPGFIAYCESRTGENNPFIKGRKGKAA
jgi:hypothetical protein